jgi:hypothetical protein
MCPLPGHKPIHPRFEEANRPVAQNLMTATCTITRDGTGPGTFDPGTGLTTPPARVTVQASVPCRVQIRDTNAQVDVLGEQAVSTVAYLVSLPHDVAAVHVDDLLEVTACVDAGLVGRKLRVLDFAFSSNQWQRDLNCQDYLG